MSIQPLFLRPVAARHAMAAGVCVSVMLLSGCSSLGSLMGQSQLPLSPAAKAAAEKPLEKDPVVDTQETYLALVRQMQSKSLWYASIAHLDALDKQWGPSPESRLLRADALRQVGQLPAAVTIYQGLLGTAREGAARYGLGRVAAEQGDYVSAAQQIELARASNPVDAGLLTDLGYAYLLSGNLGAARIPLMQAAQLSPDDMQAQVNLSLFMMVSGQEEQAAELMRQRKMDAATQQAIKQQAQQWLLKSQAANTAQSAQPAQPGIAAAAAPAVSPTSPTSAAASAPASAVAAVASQPQSEAESIPDSALSSPPPTALQSAPEPFSAPQPVQARAVAEAHRADADFAVARTGSRTWMSGSRFDAGRPRSPVASPALRQPALPSERALMPASPASPVSNATQESVQRSAAVQQVRASQGQSIESILPSNALSSGLFFETPDVPAPQPVSQATPNRTAARAPQ